MRQLGACRHQPGDGVVVVASTAVAESADGIQGLLDGAGMFQQSLFLLEGLLFLLLEVGGRKFIEEKTVVVRHLVVLRLLGGELLQLMFQIGIVAEGRLVILDGAIVGEGIQQAGLEGALREGKRLVL